MSEATVEESSGAREKRSSDRRRIRLPMSVWATAHGRPVGDPEDLVCHDMSATGIAFEAATLYRLDSLIETEIHLPGHKGPLLCRLRVTRLESALRNSRYRIGAQFVDLSDTDRDAIVDVLKNVDIYSIIDEAVAGEASDIHLTVGRPPVVRAKGRLLPLESEPIEEGQIQAMLYPLLSEAQIESFERHRELDFAFSPNVASRFRVNMHVQRGFVEATMRSVPIHTTSFDELGLPDEQLQRICRAKSGLFLIAGTTGSGKTTTLSSMVDYINQHLERVVITIEDPIEFTHTGRKSIVKQRELGSDTLSYGEALRRSLRQDPDVIVVGELIEADGVLSALRAAETGHLVISTVHAPDSEQALERVINFFPPEHATAVCQQLSSCLLGILFQALLPGRVGDQVLATELMFSNHAIRNMIREKRFNQVNNCIQTGRKHGMYTLQNRLEELRAANKIAAPTVEEFSRTGERQ